MILPVEDDYGLQWLVLLTKDEQGRLHKKDVLPVRFVPMTGESQRPKPSSSAAELTNRAVIGP